MPHVSLHLLGILLAAGNTALDQPDHTPAVDGNLQTCHIIAPTSCILLAAGNIALDQPDHTSAVDGNLQTCHIIAPTWEPYLRVDLLVDRPVALVHIYSAASMTGVTVFLGECCKF